MAFFWFLSILIHATVHAQSTSANPPGQCAGYINRYTHDDQCVYSFTVPKQHQNDCNGIKSDVQYLLKEVEKLQAQHTEQSNQIQLLNRNAEAFEQNGQNKEMIRMLEIDVNEKSMRLEEAETLLREKDMEATKCFAELEHTARLLDERTKDTQPCQLKVLELESSLKMLNAELDKKLQAIQRLEDENSALLQSRNCTEINKHLPSCDAIRSYGYKKSGYMMIDPDGEDGEDPFQVYCDMDLEQGRGVTVVSHSNQGIGVAIEGCDDPGCASHRIDYQGVTMAQIRGLLSRSIYCEQSLTYQCFDSQLLKDGTAWWVSHDGRRQTYWGGATPGSGKCACGMTGTCEDPREVCNCDSNSEKMLEDGGFISDKEALPIKEVRYGDADKSKGERGISTVGPLVCRWDYLMAAKSCIELGKAGVRKSGQYWIDPDGPTGPMPAELKMCEFAAGESYDFDLAGHDPTQTVEVDLSQAKKPAKLKMWTLNDCGQQGRLGPTPQMCNETYTGTSMEGMDYMVKAGRQFFYIPETGRYKITAIAPGGLAKTAKLAGRGAELSAVFELEEGDEIRICVGQKGDVQPGKEYYGGSGGTYVVKFKDWVHTPLVIAGGGGSVAGSSHSEPNGDVSDANLAQFGKNGSKFVRSMYGMGGEPKKGGLRGSRAKGTNTPGGGAGYEEDGQATGDVRFMPDNKPSVGAQSFMEDGEGDEANCNGGIFVDTGGITINGGFGGGGSGARYSAGGGGGYAGGGGSPDEGFSGGGGSFINENLASEETEAVNNFGRGSVIFELL